MRDPATPDRQPDEYLPDLPQAHKSRPANADPQGINPTDPSTMPRGEDDERTRRESPEFHDRPGQGNRRS
jgi:hypothetical protein